MDQTPLTLKKMMDACMLRHSVLANNLANVNTPNFKRSDIDFRKALSEAIKTDDVGKIASVEPQIKMDRDAKANSNGNSVSLQAEVASMADNMLLYSFSVGAMTKKFDGLRKAIKGN